MISKRTFAWQIPESVAEAYDGVRSLVARDGTASLEELQGAVEYLLDTVKAAHGQNSSITITRLVECTEIPRQLRHQDDRAARRRPGGRAILRLQTHGKPRRPRDPHLVDCNA